MLILQMIKLTKEEVYFFITGTMETKTKPTI